MSERLAAYQPGVVTTPETTSRTALHFGTWIALTMSGVTVVTFGLALTAAPDEVVYPFTSDAIADKWPADYLWMYPAMVLMLLFVAFVASVHEHAPPTRRIFSLVALCLAGCAATVLLVNYFVQVTVMPPSLEKGQVDGFAMLTMYNPDGVFIALEELGFLLMSLALAVLAPTFVSGRRWNGRSVGCSSRASPSPSARSSSSRWPAASIAATSSRSSSSRSSGRRSSSADRSWRSC